MNKIYNDNGILLYLIRCDLKIRLLSLRWHYSKKEKKKKEKKKKEVSMRFKFWSMSEDFRVGISLRGSSVRIC